MYACVCVYVCVCVCVCVCARARAHVCVCAGVRAVVGVGVVLLVADRRIHLTMLLDVCPCSCLLMFVCLPLFETLSLL